jgi:hypothetical protein
MIKHLRANLAGPVATPVFIYSADARTRRCDRLCRYARADGSWYRTLGLDTFGVGFVELPWTQINWSSPYDVARGSHAEFEDRGRSRGGLV